MISKEKLEEIVKNKFPNSTNIKLVDLKRDQMHYLLEIADPSFQGCTLLQQHRIVKQALKDYFDNNTLHALTIKTSLPSAS